MLSALSKSIICPFYKRDNEKSLTITCEGHAGCVNCISSFRSKKQLRAYAANYCQSDYEICDIYKMANSKYEEQ